MIAWFARNGVAANLLMGLIVCGGLLSLGKVRKVVFPEMSSNVVSVTVRYPGAAPEEVEEAICVRIEEQIRGLETVRRVRSVAAEDLGTVRIEFLAGTDVRRALDDVKIRIDAIDSFPEDAEKPIVQQHAVRLQVMSVVISGEADEMSLKRLGVRMRDEIAALESVTLVDLEAVRPYEIAIEVSEQMLRRHGLTFDRVVEGVRQSSLDLPGGAIRTDGGEILLRTKGQAYGERAFEELVLWSRPDGTRLTLGDVADVSFGFAEVDRLARFDGQPAVLLQVFRYGNQHATRIADEVKSYLATARARVPEGIELTLWQDDTEILRSRLDALLRSGRAGIVLVLLVLALFLKLRLAAWVALGIPVSLLGALWVMPWLDLSINFMSLFAFIMVLGIVVDDAIVVGENIYRHYGAATSGLQAAIDGAREIAAPVIFSILTTIAAFAPLSTLPGDNGQILRSIPLIVIATLMFSLIESLLVLPAHLSHRPVSFQSGASEGERYQRLGGLRALRSRSESLLRAHFWPRFRSLLRLAVSWRYATAAIAFAALLMTLSLVAGGHVRFAFLPDVDADYLAAFLTMPEGTSPAETSEALARIEESARELQRDLAERGKPGLFRHVLTSVGAHPFRDKQSRSTTTLPGSAGPHLGEVNIELSPAEEREVKASTLLRRWRERTCSIPGAVELVFDSSAVSAGAAINIQLASSDIDVLRAAAAELKAALGRYPGVFDVADSLRLGKREFRVALSPEAEIAGLTLGDLARQVRQGFYGEEAQRVQVGGEELKVMVRYPESERRSLSQLEQTRIRAADGVAVPFSVAGQLDGGRGLSSIVRSGGKRVANVTADVDREIANSNEIVLDVRESVLPELLARHPGLSYSLEGEQQEQREVLDGLRARFLLSLFIIYALLAVAFRSYAQPIIVMSVIPFGVVGAIWGHVLMAANLTLFSGFGIVAVIGVVVNDSLIMIDFMNRRRAGNQPIAKAVREAAERRLRPILLTSVTTFAGLSPLLFEKSLGAQFVKPTAISLAFGILFSTVFVVFVVPAAYSILEDLRRGASKLVRGAAH